MDLSWTTGVWNIQNHGHRDSWRPSWRLGWQHVFWCRCTRLRLAKSTRCRSWRDVCNLDLGADSQIEHSIRKYTEA